MSYLDRLKNDREWSGHLTLENFDLVVDRLRRMIGDGQPYAWVAVNQGSAYRPEVRTGQRVREEIRVNREPLEDGTRWAHVSVHDTDRVWGLHTTAADEKAANGLPENQRTRLAFERGQLRVTHYALAGNLLYWVIAPEAGEG